MRARSSRSTRLAAASSRPGPSPKPPGAGRGRAFSFLTVLMLVLGMLVPFSMVQQVTAAPLGDPDLAVEGEALQGGPPPLQGVFAVTIVGDVANVVGPVSLSNQGNGIWQGTAPLPPGSYGFSVSVSTNDGEVNAGSSQVNVTDDAAGAVFEFNANNGRISSGPLLITLNTDVGSFPMVPDNSGNFVATFDGFPGSPINVETAINGQPTGSTAQPVGGNEGRVRVVADASGNILQAGGIDTGQLTVVKTDDQGNPQPGACFAVTGGSGYASQACDSSDGSLDGQTTLYFPDGIPGGGNLVETFTPSGQDAADDQQIGLAPGFNQEQVSIEGVGGEEDPQFPEDEPTDEPIEEPTISQGPTTAQISFIAVDQSGNLLPGACFVIEGVGQQCDDDFDGVTTFDNVQLGVHILTSTQAPEGYQNIQPTQIDVQGDQQFNVPFQQQAPQTGTLAVTTIDENGNELPGVCYNLSQFGQQCDGDDADAVMTQTDVPAGEYTVELVVSEGYQAAGPTTQQITVQPGQTATVQFQVQTAGPSTFTVAITTVDENGFALGGACYQIDGVGQQCDDDFDGVTTFTDVPAGSYNVSQTQAPQGYDPAAPQQIDVQGDQQITFINQETPVEPAATDTPEVPVEPTPTIEQPTDPSAEGFTVGLVALDPDNNLVPGACYSLDGSPEVCDVDNDGTAVFEGVSAGSHVATMTQAPAGFQNAGALGIDVQGDQQFAVRLTPTEEQPGEGFGTIAASVVDENGTPIPGACFEIVGVDQDCDGEDDDAIMTQPDVPVGTYTVNLIVPDGYTAVGPATQQVTVNADETANVQFQVTSQQTEVPTETPTETVVEPTPTEDSGVIPAEGFGSLQVVVTDEGFPIVGACVSYSGPASGQVCDGDPSDADPNQASILIQDLPAGQYQVGMPNPPQGFDPAAPVAATVVDGEVTQVVLQTGGEVVPPAEPTETPTEEVIPTETSVPTETPTPEPTTGDLVITVTDANGSPLPGACFTLNGTSQICDNGDGDSDPAVGTIRIADLSAGDVSIEETQAPEGFLASDPQVVTVPAGGEVTAQFVNEPAPPPAGSFRVVKRDTDGIRIGGSCWTLTGEQTFGPFCDNDENDIDPRDGVIEVENIPVGTYTLSESTVPEGYLPVADQSITINEGERTGVSLVDEAATGSLVITKTDEQGSALGGACFTVGDVSVCDDGDGDSANTVPGTIQVDGLPEGNYQITETQAPEGYVASGEPVGITITAGQQATATFQNSRETGSVEITKVDLADGATTIGGACFSVAGQTVCDNQDGDGNDAEGVILISGVPEGPQTVSETQAPEGFTAGDDVEVSVIAGETATVTIGNQRQTGTLQILKVDAADTSVTLGGACFSIDGGEPICDNGEGDADPKAGSIVVEGLALGDHEVVETQAPEGYAVSGESQTATVSAGEPATLTFENALSQGQIRILKVDQDGGASLGGACFTIDDGLPVCDNNTGDLDPAEGVILVDAPAGTRTVTEVTAPEGYDPVLSPQTVDVPDGGVAEITFENSAFTGSVRIAKTDNSTQLPLGGACFTLQDAEGNTFGPVCDNGEGDSDPAEGVVVLQGVTAGTYDVLESTTPEGYVAPEGPVATGIQVTSGQAADVAVGNEPVDVPTPTPLPAGSVLIEKVDQNGAPLGGACFQLAGSTDVGPVCDNGPADTDPAEGMIGIANVPEGAYTLIETSAPDGFALAANQNISVSIGETTTTQVVNEPTAPQVGVLTIGVTDESGNLLGGACFTYGGNNVCDNGINDENPAPGQIQVSGVQAGTYDLVQTVAPTGFQIAETQSFDIVAGETTPVYVVQTPAEPETGGLEIDLTDDEGNPVEGACISLVPSSNVTGGETIVLCDGGDEDTNPAPGVLVVEDLPVGTWTVNQTSVPGEEAAQVAGVDFKVQPLQGDTVSAAAISSNSKTVTVKPNVIVIVIIIIIVNPPTEGSLQIVKRAQDTNLLQGDVCFNVTGQGNDIDVCDNDGVDQNMTVGVILLTELGEGDYNVTETQAPPGYDPAPPQTATVIGGVKVSITFRDPKSDTPGELTILKIDGNGDPVVGTCFSLRQGNSTVYGPICDDADGANDGQITFTDVTPGTYKLRETTTAGPDWQPISDITVTIVAGENPALPVVNTLKTGSVRITKQNQDGTQQLGGSCFGLDRGNGLEVVTCDNQPGDADPAVGIILINNVPPGAYELVETQAPPGYDVGPNADITVSPAQVTPVTVRNIPAPPPTDVGNLTILKKDQKGSALAGACFILKQGNVTRYGPVCDEDDGNSDGTIRFTNVGVGDYAVVETRKPSADYQTPPVVYVTIQKDQTRTIPVTNVLRPGLIQITKVDQKGHPLTGACFKVTPGNFAVQCTDGSGIAVFQGLPPGVYTVTETKAPYGYQLAPAVTNVVVNPGLTTPLTIVNKRTPPPPDAGSIKLIKFYCPQTTNAETWAVFDSSDAVQQPLALTANCKKGDATFTLTRKDGAGTPITFSTGPDGEAHLTLQAGVYVLTEKGTDTKVEVTVFVGQQTTVVVLNYVKPPKPAPVTVEVRKFTCDPGFQGQFYLDFINACGAASNLTNGVEVRLSGASVNQTRYTGDGGIQGLTRFTQLPAGNYSLQEKTPEGSSVFVWCGIRLDSYEFGAIGSIINFPIESGQTIYCAYFNVPDKVTDTTGTIVVEKYGCALPAVKRPANFDWFANCAPQTTGVRFTISKLVDGQYVPTLAGVTDVNGQLKFTNLGPGTYKLQEVGADWCHAESDAVNAQGDVVVQAGKRSTVWIFNCIPTKEPPNTGVGTTAGLVLPGLAPSGAGAEVILPQGGIAMEYRGRLVAIFG